MKSSKTRRKLALARKMPHSFHALEALEVRALFSALIAVSGNSASISSGDITPSATDFTDFGYMSTKANTLIGKLTHKFTITNTGDGTLTLTGGTKPVVITGPNASDFSVLTLPGTSITAGTANGTDFVIAFTPKGKGLRKATITIPSNDTNTPAFTFVVQGTGVATTNFSNGLQIGTVVIGTGTDKAIPGSQLTINYTEILTDGTVIASSLDPGGTPFEFTLGIGQVIPGWDQGLIGLKENETRVLFVPSDLAFGEDGSGEVPPDAPLIYTISTVDLEQPLVAISGNNIDIAFNDTTPSATDGTLIGTTTAGSTTPISFTFKLTNAGQGSIFYPNNNIIITGKNAAAFTTTPLTADTGGTFATFTVTYHPPANAGTSNAVVNVITNDPLHPDFKFNISGVATPFQDLSVAVSTQNYAAPIITGATTKFKIPVKVTNQGNLPVAKTPITFDVYLHNATGGTDTLIASSTTSSLGNLGVGKTTTINLNVPIPITIPTGAYEFLVKVNADHNLTETDYSDNNALSTQVLAMTQGFYDLAATISTGNSPGTGTVISGSSTKYKVPITVTNTGNLPIPSNAAPITFNLYVRNATGGADTLITSFSGTSLRNLAVGRQAKLSFSAALPIALETGTYQFLLKANENAALTESTLSNNNPLSPQVFSIVHGFHNITGNLSTSTYATALTAGAPLSGKITFVIENIGNLTLPSSQKLAVQLVAVSDADDTQIPIGTPGTLSLGSWISHKSGTFTLSKTLLAGLTSGSYHLAVAISPIGLLQPAGDDLLEQTSGASTFNLLIS
jgi:hypothetical protein